MDDTNASAKVKTAASLPIMALFGLPKLEVPATLREAAESGAAQAKDACEKARAATENATDLIEETYAIAVKGTVDYNLKVFAAARASVYAAFDFVSELVGVTSLSAAVELTTTHARMQLEAATEQTRSSPPPPRSSALIRSRRSRPASPRHSGRLLKLESVAG